MRVTVGLIGGASANPLVALALALRERGHGVTVVGSDDAARLVDDWQLPFHGVCDDLRPFMSAQPAARTLRRGDWRGVERLAARYAHGQRDMLRRDLLDACAGADVIVAPALVAAEAMTLADILATALVLVAATPSVPPSWHLPQPFIAARPSPLAPLNRLTHARYDRAVSAGLRRRDDREWRALEGLATVRRGFIREAMRRRIAQLHVYSTSLYPRGPDWPDFVESVGRVTIASARRFAVGGGRLAPELRAWLQAGTPPVAIALGDGWSPPDTATHLRIAQRLTRALGVRVVVCSSGAIASANAGRSTIFAAAGADAEALFPHCRAVIHGGDAATAASAAHAGVPAVVCPLAADGTMWGERLRALGIGEVLPRGRFDTGRIAAALRRLDCSALRQRAQQIAARIAAENGTPAAIATIERVHRGEPAAFARERPTLR